MIKKYTAIAFLILSFKLFSTSFTPDYLCAEESLKPHVTQEPIPGFGSYKLEKVLLFPNQFPKNQLIEVIIKRQVLDASFPSCTFKVMNLGSLVDLRPANPDNNTICPKLEMNGLAYYAKDFFPGEACEIEFRCKNNLICSALTCPNVFAECDESGKLIMIAHLVSPLPTLYSLELMGMKKGDKFTFSGECNGEKFCDKTTYSEKNIMMIYPGVLGKEGGNAHFNIVLGDKVLNFCLPWGEALAKQKEV